jgi:hypothetical protein
VQVALALLLICVRSLLDIALNGIHQYHIAGLQEIFRNVHMNVRVDTAVHGKQLHMPVTSIAQDAAEADAMLAKKQASAGDGSRGSATSISTALRLQPGTLATELPAQTQYMRLAKKGQLHGTVNGAAYKQTVGVAKLTPKTLIADGDVPVLLQPFTPAQRQHLFAAAAAGDLQLSVTLVETGMDAGQPTTFVQPAQQTSAVARIKLDMLSVSHDTTTAAAAPPAGGAASGAAQTPTAAIPSPQPGLMPSSDAAGASVIARLVSVEQRVDGISRSIQNLHISVDAQLRSSQSHSMQLDQRTCAMETKVDEHQSHFQHILQVVLKHGAD